MLLKINKAMWEKQIFTAFLNCCCLIISEKYVLIPNFFCLDSKLGSGITCKPVKIDPHQWSPGGKNNG